MIMAFASALGLPRIWIVGLISTEIRFMLIFLLFYWLLLGRVSSPRLSHFICTHFPAGRAYYDTLSKKLHIFNNASDLGISHTNFQSVHVN